MNPNGQRNGIKFEGHRRLDLGDPRRDRSQRSGVAATPLPQNAMRLYESKDHMGNFFDCVRSRKPPICDAEIGHRSATMCHLGAISLRTGRKLNGTPRTRSSWASTRPKRTATVREMRKPYDYSFVKG